MASVIASNFAAVLPCSSLKGSRSRVQPSPVLGLHLVASNGRIRCCMVEQKPSAKCMGSSSSMVASLIAMAAAVTATTGPAMALVDDRMSTEGTGLAFGLSNNLLGWILLGIFALIWSLYFVYTSSLEEDEESGLSL